MSITERATVAVFGVLLAWMVMAVAVGTDDKGKTASTEKKPGASAEKIEIIRVVPVLTDSQDRFMLIGGTDKRDGYWTDPKTGEQVKILTSRPVPIVIPWVGFMLIGRDDQG
jgi:hypothetical protein